jgi:hypothetical protein
MAKLRTQVRFIAEGFNKTEPRDYFINACCFGDDVAKWLMGELRKKGLALDDEPGQEDFGWYFGFQVNGVPYQFIIGSIEESPYWLGWIERDRGFLASILGGRRRGIDPAAAQLIQEILSQSGRISDIRWWHWREFDRDNEEKLWSKSPMEQ